MRTGAIGNPYRWEAKPCKHPNHETHLVWDGEDFEISGECWDCFAEVECVFVRNGEAITVRWIDEGTEICVHCDEMEDNCDCRSCEQCGALADEDSCTECEHIPKDFLNDDDSCDCGC